MISHALIIVINELNKHLKDSYGVDPPQVRLANAAEVVIPGAGGNGDSREMVSLTVVNIKEEKTLKNLKNYIRNDTTASYQNPPVFLNFLILISATHKEYTNAVLLLSRVIRFFQFKNVFTHDNVNPESITKSAPVKPPDQLESFKLIFDLYSPTLEEINHLWGTLGGKQYPFVLYMLRMLDLQFKAIQSESALITEVVSSFSHKKAGQS